MIDNDRISILNSNSPAAKGDCVVYWMQRDQRVFDNWALLRAAQLAEEQGVALVVAVSVHRSYGMSLLRHYDFMLRGLMEVSAALRGLGIGFVVEAHTSISETLDFLKSFNPAAVVTDQDYLRAARARRVWVAERIAVRMEAVDAGTVVPPALVMPKAAYGAYILRPKLAKLRERFIVPYPEIRVRKRWLGQEWSLADEAAVRSLEDQLELDGTVGRVDLVPGYVAGMKAAEAFLEGGMVAYDAMRNDPTKAATSRLSAYLHFGQISSQEVAYRLLGSEDYHLHPDAAESFLDELITWHELAVNHVLYNENYRSFEGLPSWSQQSLSDHEDDHREYLYNYEELDSGATHDELWNAAQREMILTGRMHGYMRMYWAKKILEWTNNARQAIEWACRLNDRYLLDGRDPNGYAGVMWAVGGLHDRPWFDRPIYGKVRYMSYGGAKSKFDVQAYIAWTKTLAPAEPIS